MLIVFNFLPMQCQILKFGQVFLFDISYNLHQIEYSKWRESNRPNHYLLLVAVQKVFFQKC